MAPEIKVLNIEPAAVTRAMRKQVFETLSSLRGEELKDPLAEEESPAGA